MPHNHNKPNIPGNQLKLEIATPEGLIFEGYVKRVEVPGEVGIFIVLPGHAPLISVLKPGKLRYSASGKIKLIHTGKGIMQVKHDHVIITTESAI